MFFYYCFTNKFGYDQICWDAAGIGKPGDLIVANGSHFIALGQILSWQQHYLDPNFQFPILNAEVIGSAFGKQTLEFIHWMVYFYYTSYRSIIHLFMPDVSYYLKAIQKAKTLKGKDLKQFAELNSIATMNWDDPLKPVHDKALKQALVIFPDLLSLRYRSRDMDLILSGQDTMNKIMRYYYDVQCGYKNILITTSANIFMDRKNLSQIIFYFPKTWYYKSHQNPRYYVPELVDKMAEIRKAKVIKVEVQN